MSQQWRSQVAVETATSRFLRGRWDPGSLYVLDVDNLICDIRGVAALAEARRFVGCDIDRAAVETTAGRLAA